MMSRDQIRAELFSALAELSRLRPEWRLGQTLANAAMTAGRIEAGAVWDLDDEEALRAVRVLIDESNQPVADAADCRRDPEGAQIVEVKS